MSKKDSIVKVLVKSNNIKDCHLNQCLLSMYLFIDEVTMMKTFVLAVTQTGCLLPEKLASGTQLVTIFHHPVLAGSISSITLVCEAVHCSFLS